MISLEDSLRLLAVTRLIRSISPSWPSWEMDLLAQEEEHRHLQEQGQVVAEVALLRLEHLEVRTSLVELCLLLLLLVVTGDKVKVATTGAQEEAGLGPSL